jgi:hypothetical protein
MWPACSHYQPDGKKRSILLGEHDGDDALGNGGIRWVRGEISKRFIVIVDLEKDVVAVDFERAKVVLFVRIVGVAEIVEHGDRLYEARNDLFA